MTSTTFSRPLFQLFAPILFLLLPFFVSGQIRCGTVENDIKRHLANPALETTDQFERWMRTKISQGKLQKLSGDRTEAVTYTIPIVVHIIHNGEAVGVGTNIPDAQVISQIDAINRDYPRLNPDSVNTPAEFAVVAGKINMKFVLAKQDPEGVPTSGITRTKGTQTSWVGKDDETQWKSLSYWPAEDYLNIWVVNFTGGLLGLAQLPVSTLPGLEDSTDDRLTDGVGIHYKAFGQGSQFDLLPNFNMGRTATHEIGHIFGLRHIWGDVTACTGTDYCDDTPNQSDSTSGCPTQPSKTCSDQHDKMFQNYMDYTNDPCYNLFTKDQIARMIVVLGNSPRRASLLVSPGGNDPTVVANDLGVRKIIAPDITACGATSFVPVIQIRNYGSNNITGAQIQLVVNGVVKDTKNYTLSLAYLDTLNVSFAAQTLTAPSNTVVFKITSTNGGTDGNSSNDQQTQTVTLPTKIGVPFVEPFNSLPTTWKVVNPDGGSTWQNVTAPYTTATNKAMYIDFFDYATVPATDKLVSPVFDLSTATVAVLKFDRAYATFSTSISDQLRIVVSTSCDTYHLIEVFNKSGSDLATAAKTTSAFVPKSAADWKTESIPLTQFLGQSNVQISFIAINQNGNNLYLDNVSVTTESFTDIALTSVVSPAPVTCLDNPVPTINVANYGSNDITQFTVTTLINNHTTVTESVSNFVLHSGQDQNFTLGAWPLTDGNNTVKITLQTPDTDLVPINNVISFNQVANSSKDKIPLRQNFEKDYPEWTLVSPGQQLNWISTSTNTNSKGLSLEYAGFTNTVIGSQAWLVSPVLDLSGVAKAGLFFDLSYAVSANGTDRLQILSSSDCGVSYPTILYDKLSDSLASSYPDPVTKKNNIKNTSSSAWAPQQNSDWKRPFVNLDSMIGDAQARLAFVITNGHGNNLFIDNIEFFISDNNQPLDVESHYAIYNNYSADVKITFNLPDKELVHLQVFNTMGQVVFDNELQDVLNQTFDIDLTGKASGIYIVRLQMGNELGTAKVLLGN